jgi:hypothetical protein
MNIPLKELSKITDPRKLEVLQLIARVERNIPRRVEDRAIRLLLDTLKDSKLDYGETLLKKVA